MFPTLAQALTTRAISKVHINGLYINNINISCGVRQGCPLSPLIFVLATQSPIDHLQHLLDTQQLQGLQIFDSLNVSYQLFGDDLSLSDISMHHMLNLCDVGTI